MLKRFLLGFFDVLWIIIVFTPSILYISFSLGVSVPFILFQNYLLRYLSLSKLSMYIDIIESFVILSIITRKRKHKWINNSLLICLFYIYGVYVYKGIVEKEIIYNVFIIVLSYGILFNFKNIVF
jgi:hypothetical protein